MIVSDSSRVLRCFQWNGVSYFHPGGMPAISRGWREARALPPDTQRKYADPGLGSQAFHSREGIPSGLASLQDAICSWLAFRWYRCARPPANRSEPFRFWGNHLHRTIMVSRTTVCKAFGHSKFKESPGWHPFDPFISPKTARNRVPMPFGAARASVDGFLACAT